MSALEEIIVFSTVRKNKNVIIYIDFYFDHNFYPTYFLQLSFPSERSELIFIDIGFLQEQHTAGSVLTLINKNSNSNYYIYNFPVY